MQEIYNVELLFKMPNTKTMRSRAAKTKNSTLPILLIYGSRSNYGTENFYGKEDIPQERTLL